MSNNQDNKFVGYEYKETVVSKELDAMWVDSMRTFGWTLEQKQPAVVKHLWGPLRVMMAPLAVFGGKFKDAVMDHDSTTRTQLTFKRDRHIAGKADLNKFQTQFENCARNIESLEASKKTGAMVAACAIGLIGTVFMGISVFSYLASMSPAFIIAAVPGFLGWIIPFFVYKALVARKTRQVNPQIEAQYDNIYAICQKAAEITCMD